ncbi:MAG: helix-turn-helix domain-containing protein [Dehalococcoidia bacterium]|nr:helix-turn-helix domain-containing protein [Dehalococcoidia bacterium]
MKAATRSRDGSRSYSSPLRERQVQQTREMVLQALMQEMAADGLRDFSMPRLARRAGVSVRTVYRYFPTKDALFSAFAEWLDDQVVAMPPILTPDDLAAAPEQLFPEFDRTEDVILAQWATEAGRDVRNRGRERRLEIYRAALAGLLAGLSREEGRQAHAIISYLHSSWAWKTFREEFGMDGHESGRAVSWAIRTLIEDLKRRKQQTLAPEEGSQEEGSRP